MRDRDGDGDEDEDGYVSLAGVPDWVFTKTRHAPNRAEAVP